MIKSHVLTISILICGLAQTAYLHENSGEIFGAVDGQEANFRCVKVGNAAVDGWNIQSVNEGGGGLQDLQWYRPEEETGPTQFVNKGGCTGSRSTEVKATLARKVAELFLKS